MQEVDQVHEDLHHRHGPTTVPSTTAWEAEPSITIQNGTAVRMSDSTKPIQGRT